MPKTPQSSRPSPAPAAAALLSIGLVAALVGLPSSAAPPRPAPREASAAQAVYFEKQVRPFLSQNCISCHGVETQMGNVRLDTRDGLMATVTPGDPEHSKLITVMHYTAKVKMPPSGKRPDTEIAVLTAWVKAGAPYPKVAAAGNWKSATRIHWAFKPVTLPATPKIVEKPAVSGAPFSSVDAFLLRQLRTKGLAFAPPADKRTLIRRASFDLTGLPPTTAEVNAFLADRSPNAFAKVVDRLLASPHYGERWGRHWLDVARYADSNGLDENVAFGYAWRYRDWVVGALNQDLPYNEFVMAQVAGDLMDSGGNDELAASRVTATGFLTLGPKVLAEPDKPKMVMDIVDEQIDVTSKAVLGLTVSCARCHDHKFDPIPTRDYYALAGIFRSTKTMRTLNTVAQVNERTLTTRALAAAQAAHRDLMKPREENVTAAHDKANTALLASIKKDAPRYRAAGWELAHTPGVLLTFGDGASANPARVMLNAVDYARGNAVRDKNNYGSTETPVLITGTPPVSAEWDVNVPKAGWYQVEIRYAAQEARPARLVINDRVVRGDAMPGVTGNRGLPGQQWEAQGVYELAQGANKIKIERHDGPISHISRVQLVPTNAPVGPTNPGTTKDVSEKIARQHDLIGPVLLRWAARLAHLSSLEEGNRQTQAADVIDALCALPEMPEAYYPEVEKAAFEKAKAERDALAQRMPQPAMVLAVEEGKPEDVRIHLRGDTQTLGNTAPRGFLTAFKVPHAPTVDPKTSGRLALAQWMVASENPLTARVQVNRVWEHLFGEAIVRTPDNFGLRGEPPTDPALLDYLAYTFVHNDRWSQKKLVRRLMLSRAYQQASSSPLQKLASIKDADNQLWWRQNHRRLEAEPLRDGILAVAGQLDLTMGGTLLTAKDGDYVTNDQSADKVQYDAPRRSLYLPIIRNALYDLYQVFDFGDGSTVMAHRASTTVSPQSLYLLNSPLVRDAAGAFAANLLKVDETDARRISRAYEQALSRPATPREVARVQAYIKRYEALLTPTEPDPVKRHNQAWQSLCQALLSSNEFLYVN